MTSDDVITHRNWTKIFIKRILVNPLNGCHLLNLRIMTSNYVITSRQITRLGIFGKGHRMYRAILRQYIFIDVEN